MPPSRPVGRIGRSGGDGQDAGGGPDAGHDLTVAGRDGVRLHVEVHGLEDAPTVVLVHGITNDLTVWDDQVHDLAARFRVVAYDQRGHGRSERPRVAELQIGHLGDDLQAVLEACVPPGEQAVLVGHSMGGIAIMAWAEGHPGEVERAAAVLLVNTAASAIMDHIAVIGVPARVQRIGRVMVRRHLLRIARAGSSRPLRWLTFGDVVAPRQFARLRVMMRGCPAATLDVFAWRLTDMDLLPDLTALSAPTMVLAGEKDRLLPPIHSRRIARRLPHLVELAVLPRIGHMAPLEAPHLVSAKVAQLVDDHLVDPRHDDLDLEA